VIRRLRERPREFTFFQAVRLLELAHPRAVRLGREGPAASEPVRLRTSSSLAFQSAEITRYEASEARGERLTTTILGLYGANSPLPAFYSTDILEYETQSGGDADPVRSFLDLFNHRLLSLLYRAWSKYRWAFTFELGVFDDISRAALALAGIGDRALREALEVPVQRLLRFTGFISQAPTSARGLAGVISDYFDDVPAAIVQCVERRVPIHPGDRSRLGANNSALGVDLVLGETIADRGGKFRIELGPLSDLAAFERFVPGGSAWQALGGLVRFLVRDPLEYDLRVGLAAETVPMLRLASAPGAARLGLTSWLCSRAPTQARWEAFRAPELRAAA
jgi:type VI secretion system protein ImpH